MMFENARHPCLNTGIVIVGRVDTVYTSWVRVNILKSQKLMVEIKVVMQGKLFQRCTHLLYCSILPMGGNVSTRRMSKPAMGSIFHIKHQWNILAVGNCYVNYQNYQNLMLLTSSDTKRTVMHLFLFTNSAQRELVSICTRVYATAINFPCITTLVEMQSCNFK